MNRLDRFFEITARGSSIGAEVRGGVVTFIAMAYIVVLNPIILSGAADVTGQKLGFTEVSATTSLAAGVMTILFGVVARLPFAFAAGLGINSFLATTVVGTVSWPEAMGLVVVNGLIIVALAVTGLASPPVGLGGGGHGSISAIPTVVFVFTLLVTGALVVQQVRGGILIGLVAGTLVAVVIEAIWHLGSAAQHPGGWTLSVPTLSGSPFALPDLSLVGAFSFDSFGRIGILAATMLVFTLVFANFFDAMGTFTGLLREAGLADAQGNFPRLRSALILEGAGAVVGGATSASSNTVFIESGAGIEEGARTGLANLVTGALFLAAMFVGPLAQIVPTEVAAAALVIVGTMMFSQLRHVDITEFSVALPVVLTVAVMPFSYSIANGIGVGFVVWVVVRSAAGKAREIRPLLWIVAAGFVLYFARGWIESLLSM
ncbi:NCS2 family permease [Mycolicibacterium sp. CBM1]